MTRAALNKKAWEKFRSLWEDLVEGFPAARTEALLRAGQAVVPVLRRQIQQRVNDPRGRVQTWQELRRGSGGGYVAISATEEDVSINRTADRFVTARDITRYLERGHPVRPPSGRAKRYKPRAKQTHVAARLFYSWTEMEATKIAVAAADEALEALCTALDDFNYG